MSEIDARFMETTNRRYEFGEWPDDCARSKREQDNDKQVHPFCRGG